MNKLILSYLNPVQQPSSPSSRTSSCDSNNSQINKYKTELCRTFEEKGSCPYGSKCRFAHGKQEIVPQAHDRKKKRCNGFWINGCCSYGRRCRFGHQEWNWENSALLFGLEAQCISDQQSCKSSKLMKILS